MSDADLVRRLEQWPWHDEIHGEAADEIKRLMTERDNDRHYIECLLGDRTAGYNRIKKLEAELATVKSQHWDTIVERDRYENELAAAREEIALLRGDDTGADSRASYWRSRYHAANADAERLAMLEADAVLDAGVARLEAVATGAALIASERRRQIEAEGWTPEHDDAHDRGELAQAAACYVGAAVAMANHSRSVETVRAYLGRKHPEVDIDTDAFSQQMLNDPIGYYYGRTGDGDVKTPSGMTHWPWDAEWWKPSDDPIRNLVKAGALIAAEIDRLHRVKADQ